eukprot:TRINITY_DN1935_c0_g1_i2.p2 TRINITY_DN1935_c0_g1~~TRINITY_DN1935_c0_g1_i2.p2  ORF type:complete len:123 (+),score=22.78 TRINITY_DN1935_c0_g1_i2:121-489(+)
MKASSSRRRSPEVDEQPAVTAASLASGGGATKRPKRTCAACHGAEATSRWSVKRSTALEKRLQIGAKSEHMIVPRDTAAWKRLKKDDPVCGAEGLGMRPGLPAAPMLLLLWLTRSAGQMEVS